MSALRKSTEVDGLSVVRALRHAQEAGHDRPPPSEPAAPAPPVRPAADAKSARIGRTAIPTRHEIHCYECQYAFQITGRAHKLFCAKCKTELEQADVTLDTECRETVKTTGVIRLAAGGTLVAGALIACDVVLAGKVRGGTVKAYRRLEIEAGAEFDQDLLSSMDLRVGPGAIVTFRGKKMYRHVEVAGELDAHLAANGVITVRAGGHLKGRLFGGHLVVEEGGGLTAEVEVHGSGQENA